MGFLLNILFNILLNFLLNVFLQGAQALTAWLKVVGINMRGSLSYQDLLLNRADLEVRVRRILGILTKICRELPQLLQLPVDTPDAARWIRSRYSLPLDIEIRTELAPLHGPPGHIQRVAYNAYVVRIDTRLAYDKVAQHAVLAHEIAHVWVHRNLGGEPDERNVDVAAVLCGCGCLILAGMRQLATFDGSTTTISNSRLGYLTITEFAYVLAVYQRLTAVNEKMLLSVLPGISKRAYRMAKSRLRNRPRCIMISRSVIVAECNVCLQKFRIPRLNGKVIRTECPICRAEFRSHPSLLSSRHFSWAFLRFVPRTPGISGIGIR
jgi:hypothetical protein